MVDKKKFVKELIKEIINEQKTINNPLLLTETVYNRLILEGKDPVELLKYKYQNIPTRVINDIISIDPTKKKSYSFWVLSRWNEESDLIEKALNKGILKKTFEYYKSHNEVQIKDCKSVREAIDNANVDDEMDDSVLGKSKEPTTYISNLAEKVDSNLANDFDIVYKDNSWLIAVPNTYEAECKLGENAHWCTANAFGNGKYYYDNYLSGGGKYYVNFDLTIPEICKGKQYPYTRYQFHFESYQFMDTSDGPIKLDEIGISEGAVNFYAENGYDIENGYDEEKEIERYETQRNEDFISINGVFYLNQEYSDDYTYTQMSDDTPLYIYNQYDKIDPICSKSVCTLGEYNNGAIRFISDNAIVIKPESMNDGIVIYDEYWGKRRYNSSWTGEKLSDCDCFDANEDYFVLVEGNNMLLPNIGWVEIDDNFDEVKINYNINNDGHYIQLKSYNVDLFVLIKNSDENDIYEPYETIIQGDIPQNRKYFELSEDGLIHCVHHNYKLNGEIEGVDNFHMIKDLGMGIYIVGRECTFANSDEEEEDCYEYNVYDRYRKKYLFKEPFDYYKILKYNSIFFHMNKDDKYGLMNYKGEIIGYGYVGYQEIEKGYVCLIKNAKASSFNYYGEKCYSLPFECDLVSLKGDNEMLLNDVILKGRDSTRQYWVFEKNGEEFLYNINEEKPVELPETNENNTQTLNENQNKYFYDIFNRMNKKGLWSS